MLHDALNSLFRQVVQISLQDLAHPATTERGATHAGDHVAQIWPGGLDPKFKLTRLASDLARNRLQRRPKRKYSCCLLLTS